jgi:hypothetical protein
LIFLTDLATVPIVKTLLTASLATLLLSSCGSLKKEEVGPYGDQRSDWKKFWQSEEERSGDWADKWMHADEHKRRKHSTVDKLNP